MTATTQYRERYHMNMSKEDKQMYGKSGATRRENMLKKVNAQSMLGQIKVCSGVKEKRKVIKRFNPHHYIFGIKLDPRNPYETNEGETL